MENKDELLNLTEVKEEKKEVKRGDNKLAFKSGLWYVLGTFITKGLAFITTPIFARLMDPSDYGEFSNFANWQSLLIIIISAELFNTLSRAFYDFKNEFDDYTSTITFTNIILNIFFYLFFLLNRSWIYGVVSIPEVYVHLMFFAMMMQSCRQIFMVRERTLYKYKSASLISVLSLVIPTILSIIVVLFVDESTRLDARMYGFYIPYGVIAFYCIYSLLKNKRVFKFKYVKYAFVLALPLLVNYLTTYLLSSTNTIITKSFLGPESAAIVSIAVSLMNVLIMLFQAVTGALTTWIMDNMEMNKIGAIKKCTSIFTIGTAIVCIGIMVLGPELILIIGGKKYLDSIGLIPGLTFGVFLQIISSVFTIMLTYRKKVVGTAVVTAVVAVASVAAKIALIKTYGINILPIINAVSFALVMVLNYLLVAKNGDRKCFKLSFMIPTILFAGLVTICCPFLYEHNTLRYALCGVGIIFVLVVLYMTKKTWMKLIKSKVSK